MFHGANSLVDHAPGNTVCSSLTTSVFYMCWFASGVGLHIYLSLDLAQDPGRYAHNILLDGTVPGHFIITIPTGVPVFYSTVDVPVTRTTPRWNIINPHCPMDDCRGSILPSICMASVNLLARGEHGE